MALLSERRRPRWNRNGSSHAVTPGRPGCDLMGRGDEGGVSYVCRHLDMSNEKQRQLARDRYTVGVAPMVRTAQARVLKQRRLTAVEELQQLRDAGLRYEAERSRLPRRRPGTLSVAEQVLAIQSAAVEELQKRHNADLKKAAKSPVALASTSQEDLPNGEPYANMALDLPPTLQKGEPYETLQKGERCSHVDIDYYFWEKVRASTSPTRFPFYLDHTALPKLPSDRASLEKQSEQLAEQMLDSFKAGKGDPFDLLDAAPRSTSPASDSSDEWDPNSKLPYMPRLKIDKRVVNALVMVAGPLGRLETDLRAHDLEVARERYRPWPSAREAMVRVAAEIVVVGAERKSAERQEIGPAPLGFNHVQFNDQIYLARDNGDESMIYIAEADSNQSLMSTAHWHQEIEYKLKLIVLDGTSKLKPKAPDANKTTRPAKVRIADNMRP
ncbi:hypothetical protein C8F04DRAFT_1185157 [Mycena alexandri]|uniref:Uncharacterized protein n=1 Tax=Mycena alexandri TaxID=1745969 RepID=A0AAD6SRG9_9AGAR|nr:hypothetical protein C8F04DRAFT_1185157 [Mycena alexandri]